MKRKVLPFFAVLYLLLSAHVGFSQSKQNANWCFGVHAGVNFNTTPPGNFWSAMVAYQNSIWHEGAGQASVSDDNGVLQFYTDGLTVWGANHQVLPNGQNLYGYSELPGFQKVVIVPKPRHPDTYYVFTLGMIYKRQVTSQPPLGRGGIHYSVVSMASGAEQVTSIKNIALKDHNGVPIDYALDYNTSPASPVYITEHTRMTTTLHGNGDKVWLIIMVDFDQNNAGTHNRYFYNYLITENGIMDGNGGVVPDGTSPGPKVATVLNNADYPDRGEQYWGAMKISPDGSLLGDAEEGQVNLYSYDRFSGATGTPPPPLHHIVYNPTNPHVTGAGLEFSPDSHQLYFSEMASGILQSNLTAKFGTYATIYQYGMFSDSLQIIRRQTVSPPTKDIITPVAPTARPLGLQLGMDQRIYVCDYAQVISQQDRLGVIQIPNQPGVGCNYDPNGLMLQANTYHNTGLPQWVHKGTAWPKIYYGNSNSTLTKGNNGDMFAYFYGFQTLTPNINHQGVLPGPPYTGMYTFQYDNGGVTNWTKTDLFPICVLHTGIMQMGAWTTNNNVLTSYYNSVTGTAAAGPSLVPANELIIAETNTGGFITLDNSYFAPNTLYLHEPSAPLAQLPMGGAVHWFKFNPVNRKLFVYSVDHDIKVYDLTNNTFALIASTPTNMVDDFVQVDNQDRVWVVKNGMLQQFNYFFPYNFTPSNIVGLAQGTFFSFGQPGNYVSNGVVLYNYGESKINYIDVVQQTVKKINTNIPAGSYEVMHYLVDGDNIYVGGELLQNSTIGNQNLSTLPPIVGQNSHFITKLSIQNDFINLREGPVEAVQSANSVKNSLRFVISPNPTSSDVINLQISKEGIRQVSGFNLIITNQSGREMKSQKSYMSGDKIYISDLERGVYFITVSDKSGSKVVQTFLRL